MERQKGVKMDSVGLVISGGKAKQDVIEVYVRKHNFFGDKYVTICVSDGKDVTVEARLTDEIIKELKGVLD